MEREFVAAAGASGVLFNPPRVIAVRDPAANGLDRIFGERCYAFYGVFISVDRFDAWPSDNPMGRRRLLSAHHRV